MIFMFLTYMSNFVLIRYYLLMMLKSSPVRCTIPALVAVAYKREQHKNTLPKAPVWSRPNTLRRLSQKSFYNSRVLERSQSRVPFYEKDVGVFYSSEVWLPFLVEQVLSLQSKSPPCSPSPFLAEQVFRNLKRGEQVWAFALSGALHKEWARPSLGPWTWTYWARQVLSHILPSSFTI